MSASKKSTTKVTKSPAPAMKEIKPAVKTVKKVVAKTATVAAEAAKAAIVAAVTRVATPVLAARAAAINSVTTTPVSTTITALADVGFGNSLYIRGSGPGLSWDQGVRMLNLGADRWQVELGESARQFDFKFLINDSTWSSGADYTVAAGTSETFTPSF